MRRAPVSLKPDHALDATRVSIGKEKLVYLLIAAKRLKYPRGKSRIAYIGTTRQGLSRIAQSVATRADKILGLPGVTSFHARVVTCKPRQRVKTWLKLERALLVAFKDRFGKVPCCNSHGKKMKAADCFDYFRRARIEDIVDDLS